MGIQLTKSDIMRDKDKKPPILRVERGKPPKPKWARNEKDPATYLKYHPICAYETST